MDINQLFFVLLFIVLISIIIKIFYCFYLPQFLIKHFDKKINKDFDSNVGVSVIIATYNNICGIQKNLEYILNQQYPIFEVIVVNDGSTDNTKEYLDTLQKRYSHLKVITLPENIGKKKALEFGIKNSSFDVLLFTDSDCIPASDKWISIMASHFLDKKNRIVLGFGDYEKNKNLLNCLIRIDTLNIAVYYSYAAIKGFPYMGVGRNIAYNKRLWHELNGFELHKHIKSGDDDLFVQQAVGKAVINIEFNPKATTISAAPKNFKSFLLQKLRHVSTSSLYSFKIKIFSSAEIISSYFFNLAVFYFFMNNYFLLAVLLLLVYNILGCLNKFKFSKRLKKSNSYFCFILFDIFAMFFYFIIFVLKILKIRKNEW